MKVLASTSRTGFPPGLLISLNNPPQEFGEDLLLWAAITL
jgi:hypothetical protein